MTLYTRSNVRNMFNEQDALRLQNLMCCYKIGRKKEVSNLILDGEQITIIVRLNYLGSYLPKDSSTVVHEHAHIQGWSDVGWTEGLVSSTSFFAEVERSRAPCDSAYSSIVWLRDMEFTI